MEMGDSNNAGMEEVEFSLAPYHETFYPYFIYSLLYEIDSISSQGNNRAYHDRTSRRRDGNEQTMPAEHSLEFSKM